MNSIRRNRGSTIAETGPAIALLLLFTIFPALTILGLGAQYCFAWYHNKLTVEELAARTAADGGGSTPAPGASVTIQNSTFKNSPVGLQIRNGFDSTGLARFCGVTASPPTIQDTVTYFARNPALPATSDRVEVLTVFDGKPFVSLPMFGFTSVQFRVASEATREVRR